ncbi:hypothetical protein J6T21_02480 [Candidatus Saccharibacteria bacterium]|nr:hypothetical protein [Candidatus Saccharibacteria bacterium]
MPDKKTNATDAAEVVPAEPATIDAVAEIIQKINSSKYILIALSGGPSIDELSAAIGLTSYLNRLGKRATAIYSGGIPDALSFLEADNSFDDSADVLQDFVISLDKNKADHLRYNPEGEEVKIFITPYKDKVSSDDLNFSYGDFNVDLVIALNVVSGIDLDDALREYGRIMQDATIVNITSGKPGKLGDIEWSNPNASSVSEMTAHLVHEMNSDVAVEGNEATAFFAGIVSATNRFSNASTTPFTLTVSSWLMECGANQQLVAENITADVDNQLYAVSNTAKTNNDVEIAHDEEPVSEEPVSNESENAESEDTESDDALADLKEIQDELNGEQVLTVEQPAAAPVEVIEPPVQEAPVVEAVPAVEAAPAIEAAPAVEAAPVPVEAPAAEPVVETPAVSDDGFIASNKETVIAVPESFNPNVPASDDNSRFGKMLEDALSTGPNPAVANAPTIAPQPEINGVPEINFAPAADIDILPPPPAPTNIPGMPQMPPVQAAVQPTPQVSPSQAPAQAFNQPVPQAAPQVAPVPEQLIQSRPPVQLVPPQPTAENNPGIADPGAFRIPGM